MNKNIKGSLIIMISAVFFSSYGIWSKLMAGEFNEFFQAWLRAVLTLLILIPVGIYNKSFKSIKRKDIIWFGVVTLPAALVFALFYYAFEHLPIGTATLFFYASLTISSYIFGWKFFNEKLSSMKLISLTLGILGLFSIFSFSISSELLLPSLACIFAGICGGTEVVFSKKISSRYSSIQISTVLFLVCIAINLPLHLISSQFNVSVSNDSQAWLGLVMHAVATLLAFSSVVWGYKYVEPSVGGIVGLLEVPFALIFGIMLFNEILTPSVIIGSLLIIIAASLPNLQSFKKKFKS